MKSIDPRIDRILRTLNQPARLERDLQSKNVNQRYIKGALLADTPVLHKEVLVELRRDEIPENFVHLIWEKIAHRFYAVNVPLTEMLPLSEDPSVIFIEAARKLHASLDTSVTEIGATALHSPAAGALGIDGREVVIGIIDDCLDFTLDDFRDAQGKTRIAYLWDQSLQPQGNEHSPAKFSLGVEYDRNAIDGALAQADPFAAVRHQPLGEDHGTHVTGIATGNGRSADTKYPTGKYTGVAPGATIIFVSNDSANVENGITNSINLCRAASYIYEKAAQLNLPCVINVSLGSNKGSHDGESVFERAIDKLLEEPGRAFVVAAGNWHTKYGHASGMVGTGDTHPLKWEVLPNDHTRNEIELWYNSSDRIAVRVVNPAGQATKWVSPGEHDDVIVGSQNTISINSERFTALNGDALIHIEVDTAGFLSPTDPPPPPVDSGTWVVELRSLESYDGQFDAWIERDHGVPSEFLSDFAPMRTISTPATTRLGIAVANYDHHVRPPVAAADSGRGRTRDGRAKPEIAAPGTKIMSSCGLGGRPDGQGGTYPVRVSMSGTSMASPHVAGAIALLLQKSPKLTAQQIRALLVAAARQISGSDFKIDMGYGPLNIERAVQLLGVMQAKP